MSEDFTQWLAQVGGSTSIPCTVELESEFTDFIRSFKEGETVRLIVKKYYAKNTKKQRAMLFGLAFKTLGDRLGYTAEEIYHLSIVVYWQENMGATKLRLSKMDTKEASDFWDWFVRWCAIVHDVVIHDPDPRWREKL